MDFDDTPEEAAFRAEARAWLARNAPPRDPDAPAPNVLSERETPAVVKAGRAWQTRKAEAGWACLTWPVEHGGRGLAPIFAAVFAQEEARFDTPPSVAGIGIAMAGPTLMAHGSEAQRRRWLPRIVRGEDIWCQLFSEPGAGSDLAGLRTRAERTGDGWVVSGRKIWTTFAHFADWGLLVARSDPAAPKHAGITYFALDMRAAGVDVRPIRQINGGAGFNEVSLDRVRIPDADRIGAVGGGFRVALATLMNERASVGPGGGGAAECWPDLLRLAREIRPNGGPALSDTYVRQRLADFYVRAQGLTYTGYRNLTALSRGRTPGPEAGLGKLVGATLLQELASFALELAGAGGALADPPGAPHAAAWQDRYLTSPGLRIAGGTDEVLRGVIAERVLGLPPEPRLDKHVPFRDVPAGAAARADLRPAPAGGRREKA